MRLGVVTALVERKSMSRTRTVGGEVIAPPGSETVVTAPVAGTLMSTNTAVVIGTAVERGRVLFRLMPIAAAEREAQVDPERAVNEAAARQDAAARKVKRAQVLVQDGAGSRRAVEEAQAELSIAEADLKAARERVALAQRSNVTGNGITLEAPFAALVRNIHATAGQTVAAGAPLFDLVKLDTVWVRVPVFVGESSDIDPRAPASIVGLGDPAEAAGVMAQPVPAPPSADPTTGGVDLYYALPNRGNALRPGQRVGVRLSRRGEADSLVVPRAALLHDALGGTWVYEARPDHVYVRRRVQVTDQVDALAILEQGPPPGTRVVTDGAAEIFGTEFGVGK